MSIAYNYFDWTTAVEGGFGNTVLKVEGEYELTVYLYEDGAYGTWTDSLEDPDEQTAYFAHRWSSYTLAMHCHP